MAMNINGHRNLLSYALEHDWRISVDELFSEIFFNTFYFQYFILLFLIFVTMLIGGILGFVFREKVEYTMRQEMFSSLKLYGSRYQVTNAWDTTQNRLKCCGVETFRDWGLKLPFSCCQEIDGYGGPRKPCQDNPSLSNVYHRGCYEVGSQFIKDRAAVIGLSGIIVAILMLFGMVFSCIFFNMIE